MSLRHCWKRFPVFSLLCPGYAQSFPILSISEDRPGHTADKPTGLQTRSSRSLTQTISSGPAPLGGEPEPLQPLGHTSDKHKLGRGRGWLIWGISRHEEVRFAANFGFKKTNCLFLFQKNTGSKLLFWLDLLMVHKAMKRESLHFQSTNQIQNYFLPFKILIFNQGKQFRVQYQQRHYTVNVATWRAIYKAAGFQMIIPV